MGNLMRRRPGGLTRGRGHRYWRSRCPHSCWRLAGCGSTTLRGASASESSESIVDLETIDDATVQETVNKAMLTDTVQLADLDPTVQEAFRRASIELDAEQLDKAFECWSNTTCEIGDGQTHARHRRGLRPEPVAQDHQDGGHPPGADLPEHREDHLHRRQRATWPSSSRTCAASPPRARRRSSATTTSVPRRCRRSRPRRQQGAFISTYVGPGAGRARRLARQPGHGDVCAVGEEMAKVSDEDLGLTGEVAILNGTPGNPQGATWNKCFEDTLQNATGRRRSRTPTGPWPARSTRPRRWSAPARSTAASSTTTPTRSRRSSRPTTRPAPRCPPIVTWTSNNGMAKVWEERLGHSRTSSRSTTRTRLNWQGRASVTAVMGLLAGEEAEPVNRRAAAVRRGREGPVPARPSGRLPRSERAHPRRPDDPDALGVLTSITAGRAGCRAPPPAVHRPDPRKGQPCPSRPHRPRRPPARPRVRGARRGRAAAHRRAACPSGTAPCRRSRTSASPSPRARSTRSSARTGPASRRWSASSAAPSHRDPGDLEIAGTGGHRGPPGGVPAARRDHRLPGRVPDRGADRGAEPLPRDRRRSPPGVRRDGRLGRGAAQHLRLRHRHRRSRPRRCPPGDRQLVEIVRAVACEPKVLILDEATSALDSHGVDFVLDLMREVAAEGSAVLFVTHRLSEVMRVADRVTVLRDGRFQGTHEAATVDPQRWSS